ncbi:MAG: N-acetylneuraminate synthase family protein, partial [Flavobacteriales bacterium]
ITNYPYLKKIAAKSKPVIVSTGMASMSEIADAVRVLTENGITKNQITILHCNSQYPTPLEDVHLHAMKTIAAEFGVPVGYSDHTLGIEVAVAAVALGATVIEKHITLDKTMPGPDHKASIEPDELKTMVRLIRQVEIALGGVEKKPTPSETTNLIPARKSIHIARDLKSGHVLTEKDLTTKRPGNGISPMKWDEVLGKRIKTDKKQGDILLWQDIE